MSQGQGGSKPNYEPNSFSDAPKQSGHAEVRQGLSDVAIDRFDHQDGNDNYSQAGDLFRLMNADQKQQLFNNIAEAMQGVDAEIVARQLVHFNSADPAYGAGVAKALKL